MQVAQGETSIGHLPPYWTAFAARADCAKADHARGVGAKERVAVADANRNDRDTASHRESDPRTAAPLAERPEAMMLLQPDEQLERLAEAA